MSMKSTPAGRVSRRAFLAGACGLAVAGMAAAPAAAESAIKRLPDGRVAVRVAKVPSLAKVGGAAQLGTVKGTPVAVVRTDTGYEALSLRCPHAGATVQRQSPGWVCPAHGSQFEIDGELVRGPATTSLAEVPSRLRRGVLTVG